MSFLAVHAGRPGPVEFISLPMAAPDDFSALQQQLEDDFSRADLLALFIKTPGNGLDNDWSRKLAQHALAPVLSGPVSGGKEATAAMPPLRMISGGCEGFITPHMVALVARSVTPATPNGSHGTLVAARAASAPLAEAAIGTAAQIEAAAATVRSALAALDVTASQVSYIHAVTPMTSDGHASKPRSRATTALGAAVALGELDMALAQEALINARMDVYGQRCGVTAGDTDGRIDLIVFAQVPVEAAKKMHQGSRVAANCQSMRCMSLADPIEMATVRECLSSNDATTRAAVAAVIYKGDPPAEGYLHGELLGMRGDSDLPAFRHFRAAMSGVLACTTQTSRLLIGGGAEHQCPVGGGLLTLVLNNKPALQGKRHD